MMQGAEGRKEHRRAWVVNGVGIAGLVMLGAGVWLVSPAVSLIAVGAILVVLAVVAAVR